MQDAGGGSAGEPRAAESPPGAGRPPIAGEPPERSPGPDHLAGAPVSTGDQGPAGSLRGSLAGYAGVVALLCAGSLVLFWRVFLTGHPTTTVTCQCGDTAQAIWFMRWTPWAIAHGHDPFWSNAIFAGQGGANMLVNTSWIFPALLLAPVTAWLGPIASFNVAVALAPVVSGTAMFAAVRRVTRFVPGQLAATALWAFSPFLLGGLPLGHLNFTWLWYPPAVFVLGHELLARRRRSPVAVGLLLGGSSVLEFFTSTELLAIVVLGGAIGAIVACGLVPRRALAQWRRACTALLVAGLSAGAALAYPIWVALAGPAHIVGLPWPNVPEIGSALPWLYDAGSAVHHTSPMLDLGGYFGPAGLPAPFLGSFLIAFLAASAVVWWRSRLAVGVLVAGAVFELCSLGTLLRPDHATAIAPSGSAEWWLPWRLLQHVPLLADVYPTRLSILVTACACMLIALSCDRWWAEARRLAPLGRRRARGALGATAITIAAWGSLVPIATGTTVPFTMHPSPAPAWFEDIAARLRPGTVVLTYPIPSSGIPSAMAWQAEDAMQIRLVGGYAIVPGRDGRHSANILPNVGAEPILNLLSFAFSGPLPAGAHAVATVRAALIAWGVQVVVVTDEGRSPPYAVQFLTEVLDRRPLHDGGTSVWYGVAKPLPGPGAILAR